MQEINLFQARRNKGGGGEEKDLRLLGIRGWKTKALDITYGGCQDPHRVVLSAKKRRLEGTTVFKKTV
jgi:hypothetical protein